MDANAKLTGIQQLPMGQQMAGGPPMRGKPPMAPPMAPPMTKPPMGPATPPPPMSPPMGEPEMMAMDEPEMNPQQDAAMLAEAVVDKTRGNVEAAITLLDTSKAMLMQATGGGQDPMMANMGGPLMMNQGGPLKAVPSNNKGLSKLPQNVRNKMGFMNMGGPLYREDGGTMSDTDILRQMIMDSLADSGRTMSDKDMSGRTMSNVDALNTLMNYKMS